MPRKKEIDENQAKIINLAFLLGGVELVEEFLLICDIKVTKRSAYRYVTEKEEIDKAKRELKKRNFAFSVSKNKSLRQAAIEHSIHTQLVYIFLEELKND